MTVTAIEKTKKGRYSVFIDGEFAFAASDEVIIGCGLKYGLTLTPERFSQVRYTAMKKTAQERALRLLSYKSYTKNGMVERLLEYADEDIAREVVERLAELGLINDEDYAERYAEELLQGKKYGARRVIYELTKRGVEKELAENTVQRIAPDTVDTITAIIDRRYARYLADQKGRQKTTNALARMGYGYEDIKKALSGYEIYEDYED